LVGVACVFYGNSGVQKYGLKCWILEFPAKAYPSQIAMMEKVINFSFLDGHYLLALITYNVLLAIIR
jgi:prepilin-type processing-associated H-X9-DG protein